MIRRTDNVIRNKRVRGQAVSDVANQLAGVTDLVNVYDFEKDAARTQGALGPLPTPQLIDSDGQLTLVAGAYPVGTAKYLTKDISPIVGDWEFTILCLRSVVEFGVTVTNAAGDKSISLIQRSASLNNAIVRQTTYATVTTVSTFGDSGIYQNTVPIFYSVRKVGTDILFYTSTDGTSFTLRHTEPIATHILSADRVGFFLGAATTASGTVYRFTGVGAGSTPYTDNFDDRSLSVDWAWYNDAAAATAVEVDRFYGYSDDALPLTIQGCDFQYGVDPSHFGTENQKDTLSPTLSFGFEYSVSASLPDPYGNSDTLALSPTFSFTHA